MFVAAKKKTITVSFRKDRFVKGGFGSSTVFACKVSKFWGVMVHTLVRHSREKDQYQKKRASSEVYLKGMRRFSPYPNLTKKIAYSLLG